MICDNTALLGCTHYARKYTHNQSTAFEYTAAKQCFKAGSDVVEKHPIVSVPQCLQCFRLPQKVRSGVNFVDVVYVMWPVRMEL